MEDEVDRAPPSIFAQCRRPLTLKFAEVEYKIKIPSNGGLFCGGLFGSTKSNKLQSPPEKKILKGVSGIVKPGEMIAMLGPSGSGKTTLLTALGGRLAGTGRTLSGSITYNGRPFSTSLKRSLGFVTQDDILYPHLTVSETLLYTALLRLPRCLSKQQKAQHAEAVLDQLGLTRCRNSIIGGTLVRGVSGGERKRVSIGQEMLIDPSLLFLDEPTSGLDSTTAQRIVSTLRDLAGGGRTVVMTIHQPSSSLFYMFHKVLLLSEGNEIYFGKGSEAMDYLAGIGFSPNVPMNPADFLLDLANGIHPGALESTGYQIVDVKETLYSAYRAQLQDRVKLEIKEADDQFGVVAKNDKKLSGKWATSWWDQFTILLKRGLKERKHEAFSGLKIAQILFVGPLAGGLWWQSGGKVPDQVGLLFFVVGFWGFFPLFQAIFTFPQERAMLTKERSSGMYRLSSYFMSRIVGDLPMELVLPTIFVTIVYFMAGLKISGAAFFAFLFIMLLAVLVAQGLGLAIGALVMDLKAATTLGSVIMLTFMLAGGYYVQSVPAFISWIKYVSISFYAFKLLISTQYTPVETYQCAPGLTCKLEDFPAIKVTGVGHVALALAALLLMFFFYRFLAYLALMRIGVAN